MTLLELAKLAKDVRDKQRAYFRPSTRNNTTLQESKEAERYLDRVLADILDPQLFGSER